MSISHRFINLGSRYTIGIDEVGRGPLAGPVVVTALALPAGIRLSDSKLPLRDSKRLSAAQREAWHAWIKKHTKIVYATSYAYTKAIDRLNISRVANIAAYRAYSHVMIKLKADNGELKAMLDAGISLPAHIPNESIVKGDEKVPAITLASIVAKVSRDRAMRRLHAIFPTYGFAENKGYGTRGHIEAIRKLGACPHHRLTFIRKFSIIKTN